MFNKHARQIQIYLLLVVNLATFADQTAPSKRVPLPDLGKLSLDCDVQALQNKKKTHLFLGL